MVVTAVTPIKGNQLAPLLKSHVLRQKHWQKRHGGTDPLTGATGAEREFT